MTITLTKSKRLRIAPVQIQSRDIKIKKMLQVGRRTIIHSNSYLVMGPCFGKVVCTSVCFPVVMAKSNPRNSGRQLSAVLNNGRENSVRLARISNSLNNSQSIHLYDHSMKVSINTNGKSISHSPKFCHIAGSDTDATG